MKPWERYQGAAQAAPKGQAGPWARYANDVFERAVKRVLKDEGGLVDDPDDRGGATNFGISSRAHPDVNVKKLTKDKAKQLYRERYWDAIGADNLSEEVRELAFDSAVQHGVGWVKEALQEVGEDAQALLDKRKKYYEGIIKRDPSQEKFKEGWFNRLERYAPKAPWKTYGGSGE